MDRPAPDRAPDPPGPELARSRLVERLAALEVSLREVAAEIAVTRESLRDPSPATPPSSRVDARAADATGSRGASGGRARLREGPLGDLFRSTLLPEEEPGEGVPCPSRTGESLEPEPEPEPEPDPELEAPPWPAQAAPSRRPTPLELVARRAPGADGSTATRGPAAERPWLEGRALELEPRRARMLANSEALLGGEHPDTLWAVHDLASALSKAGEVGLATRLAARLVEVRVRLQGVEHSHTVRAHELWAAVTGHTGRRRL